MKTRTETFALTMDSKVITVKATAFKTPASETRYRVSINDSPVHIFAADRSLHRYTDIEAGAKADIIPVAVEKAVGEQLYNLAA